MKAQVINLLEGVPQVKNDLNVSLSLKPFVDFLKTRKGGDTIHRPFFNYALKKIASCPHWNDRIEESDLEKFSDIFELIYFTFSTPMMDEKTMPWGLSKPLSPVSFFGTTGLHDLFYQADGTLRSGFIHGGSNYDESLWNIRLIYSLILERFYHISLPMQNEIVHSFRETEKGITRYYSIEMDARFVNIYLDGDLPPLDFSSFHIEEGSPEESIENLQEILPLSRFRFEGFSILQVKDISEEFAIERIKDIIVNYSSDQQVYKEIIHYLKAVSGEGNAEYRLFPLLKVNNKLTFEYMDELEQPLSQRCLRFGLEESEYSDCLEAYSENPRWIFVPDMNHIPPQSPRLVSLLKETGIESLAIIPLFSKRSLVGVLEIFSLKKNGVEAANLAKLNPVILLLGQLLQTIINDFHQNIDNIIKEKFTSLQPAVQWRFNEAAWNLIQKQKYSDKAEIEQVRFEQVYPLYGAIDVRDSTIQRNISLQNDMNCRLSLLRTLLDKIQSDLNLELLDEILFKTQKWQEQVKRFITSDDEFRLTGFLENEVEPLLDYFQKTEPKFKEEIQSYFDELGPNGITRANRSQLEESLRMINHTVGKALERLNQQIQEIYPCFFEKFRTDGFEYDIYIGQSISPQREFNLLYLRNLRLWQLSSMAEIARQTHDLIPELPKKLKTTQLIFLHDHAIDLSFRSDERRFDVEGAYNIRYEMTKKRIDKVRIKGSMKRLTQPDTISLVYFHKNDVQDYITYIHYMQEKGLLEEEMEFLELEDLQGLSGLLALRVKMKYGLAVSSKKNESDKTEVQKQTV